MAAHSGELDPVAAKVAGQILGYLDAHPDAADSRKGIERWWLPEVADSETVKQALESLVASGAVRCRQVPGGEPIYSRAGPGVQETMD